MCRKFQWFPTIFQKKKSSPEKVVMTRSDRAHIRAPVAHACRGLHHRLPRVLAVPVRDQHHHQMGARAPSLGHFVHGQTDSFDHLNKFRKI